jgi:hypothetical protein
MNRFKGILTAFTMVMITACGNGTQPSQPQLEVPTTATLTSTRWQTGFNRPLADGLQMFAVENETTGENFYPEASAKNTGSPTEYSASLELTDGHYAIMPYQTGNDGEYDFVTTVAGYTPFVNTGTSGAGLCLTKNQKFEFDVVNGEITTTMADCMPETVVSVRVENVEVPDGCSAYAYFSKNPKSVYIPLTYDAATSTLSGEQGELVGGEYWFYRENTAHIRPMVKCDNDDEPHALNQGGTSVNATPLSMASDEMFYFQMDKEGNVTPL